MGAVETRQVDFHPIRFDQIERLDFFLDETSIGLRRMSQAALFFAGKAFRRYRQSGGARSSLLPDFFNGAQAHVEGLRLLTRDPSRYRTYSPDIRLISPITCLHPRTERRLPETKANWQKFFASFFQERRFFFSEEKKQKTFDSCPPATRFSP